MSFQNIAFLFSRVSFCITFLKNYGKGYGFGTAICLKTVVGGKQGHAPCRIFSLHRCSFAAFEINGDRITCNV